MIAIQRATHWLFSLLEQRAATMRACKLAGGEFFMIVKCIQRVEEIGEESGDIKIRPAAFEHI